MVDPANPLKFPDHFPPTDRWKRFFIGVRWLGPDLSFFKSLESQQALRSEEQMIEWGGGISHEIARTISEILHKRLHWRSNVFLPNDKLFVICHGPRFDSWDEFALEEAIEVIEHRYGVKIPSSFWQGLEDATFGEFVEKFQGMYCVP
jgi:hypothetical protein